MECTPSKLSSTDGIMIDHVCTSNQCYHKLCKDNKMWIDLLKSDYDYDFKRDPKSDYIYERNLMYKTDADILFELKARSDEIWTHTYYIDEMNGQYNKWNIDTFKVVYVPIFIKNGSFIRNELIITKDNNMIISICHTSENMNLVYIS